MARGRIPAYRPPKPSKPRTPKPARKPTPAPTRRPSVTPFAKYVKEISGNIPPGEMGDVMRSAVEGLARAARGRQYNRLAPRPAAEGRAPSYMGSFASDWETLSARSAAEGRAPAYRYQGPYAERQRWVEELRRRLRAFGPGANVGRKSRRGWEDDIPTLIPLEEGEEFPLGFGDGGGGEGDGGGGGGGGGGWGPEPEPVVPPYLMPLFTWRF